MQRTSLLNKQNSKLRMVPKPKGNIDMKKKILYHLLYCSLICSQVAHASSLDINDAEAAADAMIEKSIPVTEGVFYDSVLDICPHATITDYQDGSVHIDLSGINTQNYEDHISIIYYWTCARIIAETRFRDYYDTVTFTHFPEESDTITTVTISNYNTIADFTSTCFSVGSEAEYMEGMYSQIFYNFDSKTQYQQNLNDLAAKYNLEETPLEEVTNNYLWIFSSFDPVVNYSFNDTGAVVNYMPVVTDSFDEGYRVWEEILDGLNNFEALYTLDSDSLTFYTIDIVCFGTSTEERIFEFRVERKLDGSWETLVANYYGDSFRDGVEAANQ